MIRYRPVEMKKILRGVGGGGGGGRYQKINIDQLGYLTKKIVQLIKMPRNT